MCLIRVPDVKLRPFSAHLPPRPLAEPVAARFGTEDAPSYAAFAVSEHLGRDFSISLFLRTRRLQGLVLALGNGSSQYLHVWLEDGRVAVQPHGLQILKSKSPVSDGRVHFVSVEAEAGRMRLLLAAENQGEVEAGGVAVEAGHSVHVGGLAAGGMTSGFGGYLKGCIQDLRVNDRRLQIFPPDSSGKSYPLRLVENVTAGCSEDSGCRVSKVNLTFDPAWKAHRFKYATGLSSPEEPLSSRWQLLLHLG